MPHSVLPLLLLSASAVTVAADWRSTKTPAMGWNSWNTFSINGKPLRGGRVEHVGMTEAMEASGMVAAGYNLISTVCTDWTGRDSVTNVLQQNLTLWPGGMKNFSDYLHAKGLLLSVYTDVGLLNCCQEPGSQGFETLDMHTFADWGADMVAVDYCGAPKITTQDNYQLYADGIASSSNPTMKLAVFNLGVGQAQYWAPQMNASFFRLAPDIGNLWRTLPTGGTLGIMDTLNIALNTPDLNKFTGIEYGSYPIYGQLSIGVPKDRPTIGDPGLTPLEAQSEFSMWCMFPSVLYATHDIRLRDPVVESIILNPETIAVNQDALGLAATIVKVSSPIANQTQWVRKMANGDVVLLVLNWDDFATHKATVVNFADFLDEPAASYSLRDLQKKVTDGVDCNQVTLGDLAPHQTAFLRFSLSSTPGPGCKSPVL